MIIITIIELVSFECRKVIGFASTALHDWLKNSSHFFNQSEVKPKPIVTHSRLVSRALRQLHVITSSFDWFPALSMSFVIGQSDTLVLVLPHSIENRSTNDKNK